MTPGLMLKEKIDALRRLTSLQQRPLPSLSGQHRLDSDVMLSECNLDNKVGRYTHFHKGYILHHRYKTVLKLTTLFLPLQARSWRRDGPWEGWHRGDLVGKERRRAF